MDDLWYWEEHIQPYVRASADFRFDKNWHWPDLRAYLEVLEFVADSVGHRDGCDLVALQILCETHEGAAFPLGVVLLADGFQMIPGHSEQCVFLWLMSAAPKEALAAMGLPTGIKLGRVLVDCAVQESFLKGFSGRILLHAASKKWELAANRRLYDLYMKIGLQPAPKAISRFSLFRRNDSRYFYLDEQDALEFTTVLDYLRV